MFDFFLGVIGDINFVISLTSFYNFWCFYNKIGSFVKGLNLLKIGGFRTRPKFLRPWAALEFRQQST